MKRQNTHRWEKYRQIIYPIMDFYPEHFKELLQLKKRQMIQFLKWNQYWIPFLHFYKIFTKFFHKPDLLFSKKLELDRAVVGFLVLVKSETDAREGYINCQRQYNQPVAESESEPCWLFFSFWPFELWDLSFSTRGLNRSHSSESAESNQEFPWPFLYSICLPFASKRKKLVLRHPKANQRVTETMFLKCIQ